MSPSQRQSVAQISQALGIHVATLHHWRLSWRLQGEVVPASGKDSDGWIATDQFTLMLETAGFNATELCAYCRERCLCQATLKTVPHLTSDWRLFSVLFRLGLDGGGACACSWFS